MKSRDLSIKTLLQLRQVSTIWMTRSWKPNTLVTNNWTSRDNSYKRRWNVWKITSYSLKVTKVSQIFQAWKHHQVFLEECWRTPRTHSLNWTNMDSSGMMLLHQWIHLGPVMLILLPMGLISFDYNICNYLLNVTLLIKINYY